MDIQEIDIGEAIRRGRRKKKWLQKEMAQIFGVSPSLVSSWETNVRIPSGADLIRLANMLDIVDLLFPAYEVKLKEKLITPYDKSDNQCFTPVVREKFDEIWQETNKIKERLENLEKKLL